MPETPDTTGDTQRLLGCADHAKREEVLAELFSRHRGRLRTMVQLRIDGRLGRRLDPSDVLQEAFLKARQQLHDYLRTTPMPVFLWLRRLTVQKLVDLQHHHNARKRSTRREASPWQPGSPEVTSVALLDQLEGRLSSPSHAAMRFETRKRLLALLDGLSPSDREIIALRYFEGLTGPEAAAVLGIQEDTGRKRYLRALARLRTALESAGIAAEDWRD